MTTLEQFFAIMLGVQFLHSIEELSHNFHARFPLFKMTFRFFLSFEILFFTTFLLVYLLPDLAYRSALMSFFIVLMFANGIWHITWLGIAKKYVPGIVTAPIFVIVFLAYFFNLSL